MNKPYGSFVLSTVCSLALLIGTLCAQVPILLNYQGRVVVGTTNFDGTGQFRFALVNPAGTTAYWTNDGTHLDGTQPTAAVTLPVTKGLYSAMLGDTTLTNMTAIPAGAFANADVRLRVWFNDGTNGSQLLIPDQRIAPGAYLADGAVTSTKIGAGAVTNTQLATNAVQTANIASGAVDSTKIANLAITTGILANGSVTSAKLGSDVGLWSAAGLNVFRSAGNVGIGTTTPNKRLTVVSDPSLNRGAAEFVSSGGQSWGVTAVLRTLGGADGAALLFRSRDVKNWNIRGEELGMGFQINEDGGDGEHSSGFGTPRLHLAAGGNVGVGTTTPNQKLSVEGTVESTSGGFKFPDGSVQAVAPRSGESFVIYQDGGNTIAYNTPNRRIDFSAPSASQVLQQVHDVIAPGQKIAVNGDLTLTSTVVFTKTLDLEWTGKLYSRVPAGSATFVLGSPGARFRMSRLRFGSVEGDNRTSDFVQLFNAEFNDISVTEANFFRYIFHFSPSSGYIQAQNIFRYTVLANSNKAFYFPTPTNVLQPSFAEGNQMMGGAIFACDYGIHGESQTDCGGMYVQGVIDNGGTRKDYWNESDRANMIGSLLQMSFIRYDYCRLYPADVLHNAFGPMVFGLGGIELGHSQSNNTYIDFHRTGGNPDFDVRLINGAAGTLYAEASRFHVTGTLSAQFKQFRIDHPLDPEHKDLVHGSVESAEMKNLYDGIAELDEQGDAWVELPSWFEALNEKFRYSLTPIRASMPNLYISQEVATNRFKISGGAPLKRVSWQVTGVRKDAYAKAHPLVVEQPKDETPAVKLNDARRHRIDLSKSEVGQKADVHPPLPSTKTPAPK